MGTNRKLNDGHREFILRCLACSMSYGDVVDAVKEELGIVVTRQNIKYYSDSYSNEIDEMRESLAEDLSRIPFARKERRVAYLDRVASRQFSKRQYGEFRATLKQIAEETGEIVQKMEHTGNLTGIPEIVIHGSDSPPEEQ